MSRVEPNRNVYVGHRYVPKIMGQWDNSKKYEGLSIVLHEGASYTSKGYVPVGVDIQNEEYWALTGNYNAQVEHYRQEVQSFDERINKNKGDIEDYQQELVSHIEDYNQELISQNERINDNKTLSEDNKKILDRDKTVNILTYSDMVKNNDWSVAFDTALNQLKEMGGGVLKLPTGYYKIDIPVISDADNITIKGDGMGNTVINGSDISIDKHVLTLSGDITEDITAITQPIEKGTRKISVMDDGFFEPGDMVQIMTNEIWNDDLNDWHKEELCEVVTVNNNVLTVKNKIFHDYSMNYNLTLDRIKPVENTTFEDFSVLMGGSNKQHRGVNINHFRNAYVNRVAVHDSEKSGIHLRKGIRGYTSHCYVEGSNYPSTGYGIFYDQNVQEGSITNSNGNTNRHSFEVGVGRDIVITNNFSSNDVSQGISTHGQTDNIIISHNTIKSSGGGIRTRGSNSTITENTMVNLLDTGINIGRFDGNRKGISGIGLLIKDNKIISSNLYGISITGEVLSGEISGNNIKDTTTGIRLIGKKADNTNIFGNKIINCSNIGLIIGAENVNEQTLNNININSNTVLNSGVDGIVINGNQNETGTLSDNINIYNNTSEGNSTYGILFNGYFKRLGVYNNLLDNNSISLNNPGAHCPVDNPNMYNTGEYYPKRQIVTTQESGNVRVNFNPCTEQPNVSLTPQLFCIAYATNFQQNSDGLYNSFILYTRNGNDEGIGNIPVNVIIDY